MDSGSGQVHLEEAGMKRTLTLVLSAAMLFGLMTVTPAKAGCVSTSGRCPHNPGRDGDGGFGLCGGGGGESGPVLISVKNLSKPEGSSNSELDRTPFKVKVVLSQASGKTVKVDYATSPGSAGPGDYVDVTGTLSFPPGTVSKKITVDVYPDFVGEEDEQFFMELDNPSGGKLTDASGTVTIENDDGQGPPP